jgi:hypothetical protein
MVDTSKKQMAVSPNLRLETHIILLAVGSAAIAARIWQCPKIARCAMAPDIATCRAAQAELASLLCLAPQITGGTLFRLLKYLPSCLILAWRAHLHQSFKGGQVLQPVQLGRAILLREILVEQAVSVPVLALTPTSHSMTVPLKPILA